MTMDTKSRLDVQLTDKREKQSDEINENFRDKEQSLAPNDEASQQLAEMDQESLAQNAANHEQIQSLPVIATTLAKQQSRSNQYV